MSLWTDLKKRGKYEIDISCNNCGLKFKAQVPKGMTVKQYSQNKLAECENCGCEIKLKQYSTKWLK